MVKIHTEKPRSEASLGGLRNYKTEVNSASVITVLLSEIYKEYTSGLRELVANAQRAALEAERAGIVGRGEVTITIDADRRLVIEDNGTGIRMDVFENALRVVGNSTNFDRKMPGKFGFGFGSYTLLSAAIIIDTLCEDGTGFRAIARGGTEFDLSPTPMRTTPGTTLEMILYNGEPIGNGKYNRDVSIDRLAKVARRIARVSPVRMNVRISEDVCSYIEEAAPSAYEGNGFRGLADSLRGKHGGAIYMGNDEVEVVMCWDTTEETQVSAHLVNLPIRCKRWTMPCTTFVNALDESLFPPQPTREELSADGEDALEAAVKRLVTDEFAKIARIKSYDDYVSSEHGQLFALFMSYPRFAAEFGKRAGAAPRLLASSSNEQVFTGPYGDKTTLWRALLNYGRVVFHPARTWQVKSALETANTGAALITPLWSMTDEAAAEAASFGVVDAKEYLAGLGIRLPTASRAGLENLVLHYNTSKYAKGRASELLGRDDLDFIGVDTNKLRDLISAVRVHPGTQCFGKYTEQLGGNPRVQKFSEWASSLGGRMMRTNRGEVPLSEVPDDAVFLKYEDAEPTGWTRYAAPLIVLGGATMLEVASYRIHAGKAPTPGMRTAKQVALSEYAASANAVDLEEVAEHMEGLSQVQRSILAGTFLNVYKDARGYCGAHADAMRGLDVDTADTVRMVSAYTDALRAASGGNEQLVRIAYRAVLRTADVSVLPADVAVGIIRETVLARRFPGIGDVAHEKSKRCGAPDTRRAYEIGFDAAQGPVDLSSVYTPAGMAEFREVEIEPLGDRMRVKAVLLFG